MFEEAKNPFLIIVLYKKEEENIKLIPIALEQSNNARVKTDQQMVKRDVVREI